MSEAASATHARTSLVVTTSGKLLRRDEVHDARALAAKLQVPYVPCQRGVPPEALLLHAQAVLVLRGDGVLLLDEWGSARWSPGMAKVRIQRLDDGIPQPDGILVAGELDRGDVVLDCTLGLGQDALVAARAVGPHGRVFGVEVSVPLHALTSTGIARHALGPASSAIHCVREDATRYLEVQPDASVDVVYFDPMFGRPVGAQPAFALLRRHAAKAPLTSALLEEAQRVARRWVVVKAAPHSRDLEALGLRPLPFRRSADLRFARLPGQARRVSTSSTCSP